MAVSLLAPFAGAAQEPIREFSIEVIEELGREIYRRDRAATAATEIMLGHNLELDVYPLRGWVVTEEGSGFLVTFIGEYDGEYKGVFDVRPDEKGARRFAVVERRPLSTEEAEQFRARTAAAQLEFEQQCPQRYNNVVLRDPENDGWIAYRLASTTEPGTMALGGQYRVMVSPSGEVVGADQLSLSCTYMEEPQAAGPIVVHMFSSTPIETHVFMSLLHGKPLHVLTGDERLWAVEGGSIRQTDLSERQ